MPSKYYQSTVFHGDKSGRTINFPTINLDPSVIPQDTKPGVYASRVRLADTQFSDSMLADTEFIGALYFGPRLVKGETHNVLEIFLLDFEKEIYGQTVKFCLEKFIRPVLDFASLDELKQQLQKDIEAVRNAVSSTS
jgi:riboflavin kinase/FMN adenylyltransferase